MDLTDHHNKHTPRCRVVQHTHVSSGAQSSRWRPSKLQKGIQHRTHRRTRWDVQYSSEPQIFKPLAATSGFPRRPQNLMMSFFFFFTFSEYYGITPSFWLVLPSYWWCRRARWQVGKLHPVALILTSVSFKKQQKKRHASIRIRWSKKCQLRYDKLFRIDLI